MESTGWFVVAGILGIFGLVNFCMYTDFNPNNITGIVTSMTVGILFMATGVACVVMGFRAPDKMPVQVVVKEPGKEMVMEAAKKLLSEMSVQEKYKILEDVEMED